MYAGWFIKICSQKKAAAAIANAASIFRPLKKLKTINSTSPIQKPLYTLILHNIKNLNG
jgi:hypothetical protein